MDGTIDSNRIIHMKRFLLVLLAIAVGHPVFAQLSAGAGYLKTHVSAERGSGSGEGFYAGLSYRIPLTGTFSLLPGLYFTRTEETAGEFIWGDIVWDGGFSIEKALVVPLRLQWDIDLASDIRTFLYAGPSFQYGLQCSSPSGLSNVPATDLYDEDNGFAHKRWNVLAGAGGGLSFPSKPTQRFFIMAGCDYGFLNLFVHSYTKSNRFLWKAGIGIEF